jgi:hypothetical protein
MLLWVKLTLQLCTYKTPRLLQYRILQSYYIKLSNHMQDLCYSSPTVLHHIRKTVSTDEESVNHTSASPFSAAIHKFISLNNMPSRNLTWDISPFLLKQLRITCIQLWLTKNESVLPSLTCPLQGVAKCMGFLKAAPYYTSLLFIHINVDTPYFDKNNDAALSTCKESWRTVSMILI